MTRMAVGRMERVVVDVGQERTCWVYLSSADEAQSFVKGHYFNLIRIDHFVFAKASFGLYHNMVGNTHVYPSHLLSKLLCWMYLWISYGMELLISSMAEVESLPCQMKIVV